MKRNIKLIISYDGTRYFGWEHQPNTDMTSIITSGDDIVKYQIQRQDLYLPVPP